MFYSNRSAALLALQRHRDALADGRKCVELRPGWAKGFARMGAALSGLERFTEVPPGLRLAAAVLHVAPVDRNLTRNLLFTKWQPIIDTRTLQGTRRALRFQQCVHRQKRHTSKL